MQQLLDLLYSTVMIVFYLPAFVVGFFAETDIRPYMGQNRDVNIVFLLVGFSWVCLYLVVRSIYRMFKKPTVEDKYKEMQDLNRRTCDRRGQFQNKRHTDKV